MSKKRFTARIPNPRIAVADGAGKQFDKAAAGTFACADAPGMCLATSEGCALIAGIHLPQCSKIWAKRKNRKVSSPAQISDIPSNGAMGACQSVSIVIPVYNEAATLHALWARLRPVLSDATREWEVLFVDDGSTDDSLRILREYGRHDARIRVVELARNFGQHSALLAGFRNSRGAVVVTLDADLQNPPEEIPRLLDAIAEGNDVVGGWREDRRDNPYRRLASQLHNRITSAIVGVPMHDYGCMLRAYQRHIVDTVVACDEKAAFVPALANSFAKRVAEIPVTHAERLDGKSKYNLFRLAHLSLNLITGFSNFPIQAMSLAAIAIFLLDALFVAALLIHRVAYGPQQEGAVWVLFAFTFALLGMVMLALGLIGEYIGRIYLEVRRRPTYIVRAVHQADSLPAAQHAAASPLDS